MSPSPESPTAAAALPPEAAARAPTLRRAPEVPPASHAHTGLTPTALILLIVSTVAALYLGRDVFIPLALAILLSFALGPLVTRLQRLGVPRIPAVCTVMLLVTLLLVGFGALVASQAVHLAQGLPRYEANLRAKAQALATAAPGGGIIDRTADLLRDVGQEIDKITDEATAGKQPGTAGLAGQEAGRPIPVEIHEPPAQPLQALASFVGPLLAPIATAGIVLVFIIFVLLQREDLRDRLIRLFGLGDVHRTTEALNDAGKRIGRYLLMQLVVNVLYGLPVGVGLYLIGVPNALLWGLLATVLRFIPYLGPILAALFPIALSFAVDPGWTTPLLAIGLFVALELFTNNVMEPWLYGSSTGLSPLAIIVAAVFWTTLWGPLGLLLSTPLTVCLVVLGRHVPQLKFFEVMLGDEPALDPEVKFYQRLLADDLHDAEELAADLLDERPLAEIYEQVILPALAFADEDRLRGALDRDRARGIAAMVTGIVERLAESVAEDAEEPAAANGRPRPAGQVLCVGGRNGFDLTGANMVAQLLRRKGVAARVVGVEVGLTPRMGVAGFDVVCPCYLDPSVLRQARRLILRLRGRQGGSAARFCLALWGLPVAEAEAARQATGADAVTVRLQETVERVLDLMPAAAPPEEAAMADTVVADRVGQAVSASP